MEGQASRPGRGRRGVARAAPRRRLERQEARCEEEGTGQEEGSRREADRGAPLSQLRLATWNVNSLRARQERVESWLGSVRPDIVCLQETKLSDDGFPSPAFGALGYECVHHGQGQWNGVAILSRGGIDDVVSGFADGIEPDVDARCISARCGDVSVTSVYVPNGRAVGHEQYEYKLSWLDRLVAHLESVASPDEDVVVAGDWNIAPSDVDVWSVEALEGSTHVTAAERERLAKLHEWGLTDVFRTIHPDAGLYSWWDYRDGNFHKRKGLRIDYHLVSDSLARRASWAVIDRNARKGKDPSDHAPVVLELVD